MLLNVFFIAPCPDDGADFWCAGIRELEGVYGFGDSKDQAMKTVQADALHAIAAEIYAGTRRPFYVFESIYFVPEQDVVTGT